MTTHLIHSDILKRTFCEQLGEDFDAALCAEVEEHLKECPDCTIQYDSVERTIKFYKQCCEDSDALPKGVEDRLYKVLNLRHEN